MSISRYWRTLRGMATAISERKSRKPKLHIICWLAPVIVFSSDAHAWGLITHLYFAQSLLWAMPLLDPRLQRAIRRFPELVMAGACLPDLAIVSSVFRHTHHWENSQHLLLTADTDEEIAIAIGYASHLYVDVIAHNHFVPAHEAMWLKNTIITHIAVEWAMDAHLAPLLETSPGRLLRTHKDTLIRFIAPRFRCSESRANIALQRLSFWDSVLRSFHIPRLIYCGMRIFDIRVHNHFVYYIAKTQTAIANIGMVLEGVTPSMEPELNHLSEEQMQDKRHECLNHLRLRHPSPVEYFAHNFES